MPHHDPNNWLMAFLGFPFLIADGEEQPKMNRSRLVETIVIGMVSALMAAFVGWILLIPEIKSDIRLLDQKLKDHSEHWRREDQHNQYKYNQLQNTLNDIKVSIGEMRKDFYRPSSGG